MSINIGPASSEELRPRITVIGIGGAGGNAVANMIDAEIEGVDFIVANTDGQALTSSAADRRIQLGPDITGGLGAGARPEVGRAAAEETVKEVEEALEGVNMVFIAAGMGGGTGTGAAPVIAEAARRMGVLTVGVVTKPFLFEGTRRMRAAEAGIEELQKHVDTLIVIPNQNLFLIAKAETTFKEAFQLADEVLQQGVRSITDLMVMPGLINLDFADVRSVMSEMGKAMMGTGEGEGESRALAAAEQAIANPLLDGVSMQGAKGVIISIIGGEDMKLLEVDEAANHIRELVDEDANIIWGSAFNPDLEGKIRVSVVATGIEQGAMPQRSEPTPTAVTSLAGARPPKKPAIALPIEDEALEEADSPVDDEPLELMTDGVSADGTGADAVEEEGGAEPFDLTGMQAGMDDEDEGEDDDVDDIVDPLAGMRNEENDPYAEPSGGLAEPADDSSFHAADGGASDDVEEAPLDLTAETEASGDDLLAEADRLAGEDQPAESGRRRGLLSGIGMKDSDSGDAAGGAGEQETGSQSGSAGGGGGSGGGSGGAAGAGAAAGGSTLFERMANLSRGADTGSDDDEDEDEDEDGGSGPSISIPRFLGRQNNQ
ncbi:cell division protein FtsZ [Altererythrobacter lutimaris]|uniref:Cell division protein FtsZ n=1 Tax=Altererythrobacter lutimaris TaxID=2743979 RepID=A0A850HDA1_9SPHN|nr:cell division protein FtsZ [Altererythrobacter lutimaris]NVE94688.1 cell division protein FtsZ [Altererythrobacter lutimaris]